VLVLVALVQERSKFLAAIVATMPVSAPLALWVVYAANRDQPEQVAGFTLSMAGGLIATGAFVLVSWVSLRMRLPIGIVLLVGYAAWAVVALLLRWAFPSL
jgi:uncharacterized membrane protein (GlpM family)